mmetsp:Transcript_20868/g.39489  ORF Transcript_20868/g.39489 Transcript_20868/m.39489 type:complete len:111 (-) Transcript_20868:497-829(-)
MSLSLVRDEIDQFQYDRVGSFICQHELHLKADGARKIDTNNNIVLPTCGGTHSSLHEVSERKEDTFHRCTDRRKIELRHCAREIAGLACRRKTKPWWIQLWMTRRSGCWS